MTRQNFLRLALSLSVAGGSLLAGCGGGGNGISAVATTRTRGAVVLPSGAPAAYRVANGYGERAIEASGDFDLTTLAAAPSVALVLDATGKLVLLGYIDPAAETNFLDATSTAVALLFLAIGGHQVAPQDKRALLGQLRVEPAVATLADAIAARLTANPLALDAGDPQIRSALVAARDAVRARYGVGRSVPVPGIRPVTRAEGLPPRTLVEPTGRQSGVEVVQDPARDGALVPINHHRRWCKVFAYRVGYEDANGVRRELDRAEGLNLGDSLNATPPLGGVFTTLTELFSGSAAFAPVTGRSIPLAMKEGDVKTYAEAIAIGSAFTQSEPTFFSAPRYAAEVGLWREARERLNLVSWIADIFFGLFLEVLGVRGALADFAAYEAAALAWEGIETAAIRNVVALAKSGQLPRALAEIVALGTDPAAARAIFRELMPASERLLLVVAGERAVLTEAIWSAGFKALGGLILGAPGVVLGAFDLGFVAKDLADANAADLWTATLVKPTLALSPATARLTRGGTLELTARVPGAATGATFSFAWALTGSDLANLRGDGKVGRELETTSDRVTLASTPSTQGTLTVSVKAYQLGEGGAKTFVGEARATVTMTDASTERTVFLEEYDSGRFPTPSGNSLVLTAFFVFPLAAEPVQRYRITLNGPRSSTSLYQGESSYEIQASSIPPSGPENVPVALGPRVPVARLTSNAPTSNFVYRRGGNLYFLFDSTTFYEGIFNGSSREELYARFRDLGNEFAIQFEAIS